jgi:galactokinase
MREEDRKDIPRITRDEVLEAFRGRFGSEPEFLVRTPGRVNLIGDHTDYNGGFVFPMTINRAVWMGVRGRDDGTVRVYAAGYDEEFGFDARKAPEKEQKGQAAWFEYIKGCACVLREENENQGKKLTLSGFDAVLLGDVPQGAGLASSAALEVSALLAFNELGRFGLSEIEIAKLAQRAENQWIGTRCGVIDQMICVLGKAGKAVLIDCSSLEHRYFDLFENMVIVVLDTNTRYTLVESAYNERREQCEAACRILGVSSLRDATLEMLNTRRKDMPEVLFRRAWHVLTENMRTRSAATALEYKENHLFGTLMNESHFSLRSEFDVSCSELDAICAIARAHPACLGARMTGEGFGGSAVALLYAAAAREFADYVSENYRRETGKDARAYICAPSDGGRVERL